MKYFLHFLIISSVCLSCKTKAKPDVKDSVQVADTPADETQKIIAEFRPLVQGVWIKSAYIEKVAKTKSPLAAVDEAVDATALVIYTDNIKGDSLKVMLALGNHEVGDGTLKFKRGKTPKSIKLGSDDLEVSIVNGDTCLIWHQTDKGVVTKVKYIRALQKQPGGHIDGLDHMVNKKLVTGNYFLADAIDASNIRFDDRGTISGFSNFKNYRINIDLNSDLNDNLDEIYFSDKDDHQLASYSFKINADTLKLFETYENADSTELVLGKLKYKLIRKK